MGRTPKVVEDRRDQILEAALTVFADKGFDRATNKDIAREAGITAGLIYHYFKSKKEVLLEAMEKYSPLKVIRSITPEMLEMKPEEFLRIVVQEVLAVLENGKFIAMIKVFLPEAMHNGVLAPVVFGAMKEATSFLEGLFQGQNEGWPADKRRRRAHESPASGRPDGSRSSPHGHSRPDGAEVLQGADRPKRCRNDSQGVAAEMRKLRHFVVHY